MHYKSISYARGKAHIRILATARFTFKKDLKPAIELLESWGFIVSLGKTIGAVKNQFGGDTALRIADFQEAFDDDSIHAIWIARGGYGTIQLIDSVDIVKSSLSRKRNHKIIIGYSDITVLHAALQSAGFPSIHAFMPLELKHKSDAVIENFRNAITGNAIIYEFENSNNIAAQQLTAPVIGGNLSILYSLLGSETFPETSGHILFIEDIDEYLYHIERMLYSLKRAGKLKALKAMLVGGMSDMRDHEIPFGKDVRTIIYDITEAYNYPVIFNFPAGHITENKAIKLGCEMQIEISETLIITKQ